MNDRPVVCCRNPRCKLRQFETTDKNCRRCGTSFIEAPAAPITPQVRFKPLPPLSFSIKLGIAFRLARYCCDESQGSVAKNGGKQRTYLTKIENGIVTPTLHNLEQLTKMYGVTPYGLLLMAEAIQ